LIHSGRLKIEKKKRWLAIIGRIIYIIQYLTKEGLAFRRSANRLHESCNGNFLKMVEVIAKLDPLVADPVQQIQKNSDNMHHNFGEKIQNEVILAEARKIKEGIVELLKFCKYYSVILDFIPDFSRQEQFKVIVRFVFLNENSRKIEIYEHFLRFFFLLITLWMTA
jgi:hypothetical protein